MADRPEANPLQVDRERGITLDTEAFRMYSELKTWIEDHVREIDNAATRKAGDDLLSFYIRQWNKFVKAAKRLHTHFRCLNKNWIEPHVSLGHTDVHPVFELHLVCWRDEFFMHIQGRIREVLRAKQQAGEPLITSGLEQIEGDDLLHKFCVHDFSPLTFSGPGWTALTSNTSNW